MNKEIELVDFVDNKGNVIKENTPRSHEKMYPYLHLQIVIGVIFDDKGRLLIHKRPPDKSVNPGYIDHVCGVVKSNEKPQEALLRESLEETGVRVENIRIVAKGINKYDRFRFLMTGIALNLPNQSEQYDSEWADFIEMDELLRMRDSGELNFVNDFFEETQLVKDFLS